MPELRQKWLVLIALPLILIGVVLVLLSPGGGWQWAFVLGVNGVALGVVTLIHAKSEPDGQASWLLGEKRALRRSVLRAVNRGQELQLDPGVREELLKRYRRMYKERWAYLVPALLFFASAVLGPVLEWQVSTTGLVVLGLGFVLVHVSEGREKRRVIDAVQSWPVP